jgi:hypothetical protein
VSSDRADPGPLPLRLLAGIFISSSAAIAFEITLTRVFSISLWYHFAFMVISIAMLGIGLSGTVLSLAPGLKRREHLGLYGLGLGLTLFIGYVGTNLIPFDPARLAWDRQQLLYIGAYYILLALPFFFFGLVVATSFALESERASLVYGADLLGAGGGSVAAILLMSGLGPEGSVFAISAGGLVGAALLGRPRVAAALLVALMVLAGVNPDFMKIRLSQYKGLEQALRYPGAELIKTYYSGFSRVDVFESPLARFAPGLSLKYLEPLPRQLGLAVDGAGIDAITDAGSDMEFLGFLPSALPYELAERRSVLVAEPGGGLNVLLARHYGAGYVEKAESVPIVVEVVRDDYGDFSGGIYGSDTFEKLARSRLLSTDRKYDLIDISLTGAVPSGAFGMSEDYALTVEAFREYLDHLSKDGVLSLETYLVPPPRTELRLLTTGLAALEDMGVRRPAEHIAALRSWGSMALVFKKTPFEEREISALKDFARSRSFDLLYYPSIRESETNIYVEMPNKDYYRAFRAIVDPATRDNFLRDYVFDVTPVHDESPYFHHYLKLGRLRETTAVMGGKWQYFVEEGYLLPAVLAQVLVLSLVLLLLPAFGKGARAKPSPDLAYFALLGLGFMFVEIPLIQAMILPLENPSYAVAVVLASVLVWSGAGSLLSQRFALLRTPRTVLALAALVVPYGLLLSLGAERIAAYPIAMKFALTFLLASAAGVLMGIPFPMGMRLLGRKSPGLIPWAWAINGCFSVLAPVVATMLALEFGFDTVLFLGALMYLAAFGIIKKASMA